jgi:type IV secretory pathway VirB3-like protein
MKIETKLRITSVFSGIARGLTLIFGVLFLVDNKSLTKVIGIILLFFREIMIEIYDEERFTSMLKFIEKIFNLENEND